MRLMEILKSIDKKINIQPDGLLSRTGITTLKNIKNKPLGSHEKMIYKRWVCTDCKHEFFYMMHSCVFCESTGVIENSISTGI